jgi:hypothetical protein
MRPELVIAAGGLAWCILVCANKKFATDEPADESTPTTNTETKTERETERETKTESKTKNKIKKQNNNGVIFISTNENYDDHDKNDTYVPSIIATGIGLVATVTAWGYKRYQNYYALNQMDHNYHSKYTSLSELTKSLIQN